MKTKLLKLLVKYFNLKGLATELVTEVLDETLEGVVNNTSTPFDNMAKASLWPVVEEEAKKVIEAKLDLNKLLGLEETKA